MGPPHGLSPRSGFVQPFLYGLPQNARKLIDSFAFLEAHAVVYLASEVASLWPVPTWNVPTERQSLQAARKLPAELTASIRVGATRLAMMSVGLHGRISGNPARAMALARFLDYVQGHDSVWICRREEIARHWMTEHPAQER